MLARDYHLTNFLLSPGLRDARGMRKNEVINLIFRAVGIVWWVPNTEIPSKHAQRTQTLTHNQPLTNKIENAQMLSVDVSAIDYTTS